MTIVKGKGTVAVFGDGGGGCYLEIFDPAKGTALLRFSIHNWFCGR
jgi:hypothetical protein